jgi:hypothetical protein
VHETPLASVILNTARRGFVLKGWRGAAALVALGVVLFILSGVFQSSHGFEGVLGGIGWFGFLVCVLALIVWGIVAFARSRRSAATA